MKLLKEMILDEITDINGGIEEEEILEIDEYIETEEYRLMQELEYNDSINEIKNLYN